ncbi:MAG: glycoside hydrolase family 95 protein [Oscillospiraceae bacterium]|nr:glycoside hydrolase family 95 protein [Oscillospiraceae bacterium]
MKHLIRLNAPGRKWDEGLLIGNGRLGASVVGTPAEEILTLNEESLWYGPAHDRVNPDASGKLCEVRELLKNGEIERAAFAARTGMLADPKYVSCFQPAGELRLTIPTLRGELTGYSLELDMDNALASVRFSMGGIPHRREYFVSRRRNVIAIRIENGAPMTIGASLNRRPFEDRSGRLDESTVYFTARHGEGGVGFFGAMRILAENAYTAGDFAAAENVQTAVLLISIHTDYEDKSDLQARCLKDLREAAALGYDELKAEHLADWHELYDRSDFSLQAEEADAPLPARLQAVRDGDDEKALCEDIFHFGKYLLMSSSLDCRLPANLQGLWNGEWSPPWGSGYTININTQMNYWPAEVCALPECHEALFKLVEKMLPRGQKVAKDMYGCGGFTAHHNTDLWGDSAPSGIHVNSALWNMGGAWLTLHFYEHYLFTLDEDFLRDRALPLLRKNVKFFADYLFEHKGKLITGPSISPENSYRLNGGEAAISLAPAMDIQIVREVLNAFIRSCEVLGQEDGLTETARELLSKLPETALTADGRIREWMEDYEEVEPGHRHISHLFALHPGSQITEAEPVLFKAAEKTLLHRLQNGGGHTGWSCAWIINFFARLKDGENCQKYLRQLLTKSMQDNLLDSHPPFQIDGNFGAAAGIAEMLCQSHAGYIELLPALPKEWTEGHLTGVRLRGGIALDLFWQEGRLHHAVFTAKQSCITDVKLGKKHIMLAMKANEPCTLTAANFI